MPAADEALITANGKTVSNPATTDETASVADHITGI